MKEGADDYILKNSLVRLPAAIENCLAKRQIRREKEMVESLHQRLKSAYIEIEQMHKDITDSINYARLIQDAVLPQRQQLARLFPQSFILYKPKDIVSGDFYWYSEIDGKLILAVADCTGHGVPGALMSMIGSNMLNEIVNLRRITKPGTILEELNNNIHKLFHHDTRGSRTQDGMDIGICTVNVRSQRLEFAGAHMHLYYFKPELLLSKGDRLGIGGFHPDPDRTFVNHEVRYNPGDTFYLFSDGYADQFGGKEGKRLQTRNLVNVLESIALLDLAEQEKYLSDWLDDWRGGLKQTDDILVAGVRL
jgi:serine phosphatase RsbU (regulator of sigma subunit)